jgi:hypothetical protein
MNRYTKILTLIFTSLIYLTTYSQTTEVIDNQKLIELTKLKLGDTLIISFIKSTPTNFTCGMTDILELKKEHVSENVLIEVMRICNSTKTVKVSEGNINNPLFAHPSGVYIYEPVDTGFVLKKLYATVVSNEKSGGAAHAFASSFTYGFAKSSDIVQINGPTANVGCIPASSFYFYFETEEKPSLSNWWFANATSPNEFTLIKFTKKKNNRQFTKGKSDSYTYQSGIDENQKVQFGFEELKPGIFKITPKTTLKEGEYCFIYSASVPSQYSNDKVFDFSVRK